MSSSRDPGDRTVTAAPMDSAVTPSGAGMAEPAPGSHVGRYVLGRTLGTGGMGIVYEATDPALQRRVALKLLRGQSGASSGAARLVREARAAAALSHPNVVAIYEVGLHDETPFIAMELVDGLSVRAWLAERPRGVREILDVFVQAARGLAAAHRAGLVHRDIKPDNILVGRDRVRVADFGVARAVTEADPGGEPSVPPSEERLTRPGAVVGTPRYMAPEQRARGPVDARADQYSFCLSLHEALHDRLPGSDGPSARVVPAWIQRPLLRGLDTDPGRRFPDMDALLVELGRDPAVRQRRLVALGVGGLVLLGAVAITWRAAEAPDPCRDAARHLEGVWDAARRASLQDVFVASKRGHAPRTYELVSARLDGYAADWVRARTHACEATHHRREPSERLLDLRMRCLDRQLGRVTALLRTLEGGGAETVDKAVDATLAATQELCADAEALEAVLPLPAEPAARAEIGRLQSEVDEAHAEITAARYADGEKRLESILPRVRELAHTPLLAETLRELAHAQERTGRREAALATYRELLPAAARARDDRLLAEAWSRLIYLLAQPMERPDDALALVLAAEAAAARVEGTDPEAGARLAHAVGTAYRQKNLIDEARGSYQQAVALAERHLSPESPHYIAAVNGLALVHQDVGDYAEAERLLEKIKDLRLRSHGPEHPTAGNMYQNLAALRYYQRRWDESIELHERALGIYRTTFGEGHPWVVRQLKSLSTVSLAANRLDAGEAYLRQGMAAVELMDPPNPAMRARLDVDLAKLELGRKRPEPALRLCAGAVTFFEGKPDTEDDLVGPYYCLGAAYQELGRFAESIAPLQTGLALMEKISYPPDQTAGTRFLLARGLWSSGRDRRRALALAREALPHMSEASRATRAPEVDAWAAALSR